MTQSLVGLHFGARSALGADFWLRFKRLWFFQSVLSPTLSPTHRLQDTGVTSLLGPVSSWDGPRRPWWPNTEMCALTALGQKYEIKVPFGGFRGGSCPPLQLPGLQASGACGAALQALPHLQMASPSESVPPVSLTRAFNPGFRATNHPGRSPHLQVHGLITFVTSLFSNKVPFTGAKGWGVGITLEGCHLAYYTP